MWSQRSSWLVFSLFHLCFRKNEEIFNFHLQGFICVWDSMYIDSSNLSKWGGCLKNNVRKTVRTMDNCKNKLNRFSCLCFPCFWSRKNFRSTSLFMVSPSGEKHKKEVALALCLTVLFTKLWHIFHCMLPGQWLPVGSTVDSPLLLLASFPRLHFLWEK